MITEPDDDITELKAQIDAIKFEACDYIRKLTTLKNSQALYFQKFDLQTFKDIQFLVNSKDKDLFFCKIMKCFVSLLKRQIIRDFVLVEV